ncbi:hypothetical protein JP0003_01750 [Helicobacter pylori]
MWGADLFKCNRIDYFVPNHVNDGYYPKYKRAGIKFISIDPIYTETTQKPLVLNGYPFAPILM